MSQAPAPRSLAILVFPDAETLDYAGPFEVFAVASALAPQPLFNVQLVARATGPVKGAHGFTCVATADYTSLPSPDILLAPGGFGTRALVDDTVSITWIREAAATAELVLSVCTGSFLLAKAGVLAAGDACTTHWGSIERMRQEFPRLEVREKIRFVDNGRVVTSAGISAGIDMALHTVNRLHGTAHAAKTARHMEYDWTP